MLTDLSGEMLKADLHSPLGGHCRGYRPICQQSDSDTHPPSPQAHLYVDPRTQTSIGGSKRRNREKSLAWSCPTLHPARPTARLGPWSFSCPALRARHVGDLSKVSGHTTTLSLREKTTGMVRTEASWKAPRRATARLTRHLYANKKKPTSRRAQPHNQGPG